MKASEIMVILAIATFLFLLTIDCGFWSPNSEEKGVNAKLIIKESK